MKQRHFLMLLAMLFPVWPAFATVYEGVCGPQTRYSLDTETGVLSITGTGAISRSPGETYAPWYEHWSSVKKVVVADGVGLPDYELFAGCDTTLHGMVYNSTILYHVPRNYYYDYQMAYGENYNEEGYMDFLPEGCKIIAPYACRYAIGFERVWIPDGYEEIGDFAFYFNRSFAEVRLPESMRRIGRSAFYNCQGLGGINIPEGLERTGVDCFLGTGIFTPLYNQKVFFYLPPALRNGEYTIPGNPERISDGAFSDNALQTSQLSAIHIPASVKEIGGHAFYGNSHLTNIELPEGLTTIGLYAFSGTGVETLTIPESVTSIGEGALANCHSLVTVDLPSELTVIPVALFNSCNLLQKVELPAGTDSIKDFAFSDCLALREIKLPESVDYIGWSVFNNCNALSGPLYNSRIFARMSNQSGEYTVPDGIQYIATHAFSSCDALTAVHLPASVQEIDRFAFYGCPMLTSMELPDGITEISEGLFENCTSLSSVVLPSSVTVIGGYAFQNCGRLTTMQLPDGLETIGDQAFRATSLNTVDIPSQVDSIGDWAFADCGSLSVVAIRKDIPRLGLDIFTNCPNLQEEMVLGNTYYRCPGDATECIIPEGIEHIAAKAFSGCSLLESVQMPQTVKTIGTGAFQYCQSLKSVVVPDLVRRIEDETFKYCFLLTSVQLPDSLETIGSYAFRHCESLSAIELPESLTGIGFYTFDNCHQLRAVDMPDRMTNIPNNAFSECWELRSVDLPGKLYSITDNAFAGCTSLVSIHIPSSTGSIYESAFEGCTNLASITVDEANDDYRSYSGILYSYYNGEYYVDIIPEGITEVAAPPFLDYYPSSLEITDNFCEQHPKLRSVVIPASWEGGYSSGQKRPFLGEIFQSFAGDTTYTETVDRVQWTYDITKYSLPAQIKKLTIYCDTLYQSNMNKVSSSSVNGSRGTWRGYGVFMNDLDTLVIYANTDIDPNVLNSRCRNLKSLTLNRVERLSAQCFKDMDHLQSLTIDSAGVMEKESMLLLTELKELTLPFAGAGSAYTASNFGELFGSVADDRKQRVVQFMEDGSSQTYYVPAGLEKLTLKGGFESLPYGALYNCSMLKEIEFPSTLYMVGERALYGCAGLTDIYCKGAEPSSAYSNTFEGVRVNSCKLHVPYNSSDMYRRSTGWKDFYYIEEEAPVTISVIKNIENAGVIYGLQEYQLGDEAELQAVANSGYVFSGWTENGAMVSTEDTYVFTVEGDRSLIAVFTPVSGSNDITAVPEADRVSFTWTAEDGAESYRLDVFTDEGMTELAGTLYFDADGQIVQRRSTRLTAIIDGLAASTDYYYCMTAYDADERVVSQYIGTFATTSGVGVESVCGTDGCFVRSVEGGIIVSGANGLLVRVFAVSGTVVAAHTATENRERIALDKGFYVVEVAGKAYKIVVR